jgi:hypothetical protein
MKTILEHLASNPAARLFVYVDQRKCPLSSAVIAERGRTNGWKSVEAVDLAAALHLAETNRVQEVARLERRGIGHRIEYGLP